MSLKRMFTLACIFTIVVAGVRNVGAATKVGRYAYVPENGVIAAYAFDPASGRLHAIQAIPNLGLAAAARVHPSDKFAYFATSTSGSPSPLYGFKIGTNGTLTAIAGFPITVSASWIAFTPNGKFAYTLDPDYANSVAEYSVNTTSGELTSIGTVSTGTGPNTIAFTPRGNFAYVTNIYDNSVSGFSVNATTGALTPLAGSPFATGNSGPQFDVISPNGKFLFVYSYSGETSVLEINSKTGSLTSVTGSPFSGPGGGGLAAIDPTGHFFYAATESSAGLVAYSVNQTTGALTPIPGSPFPAGSASYGVTIDPSGNYLYASDVASNENPVFVFSIEPGTGVLTEVLSEGLVGQQAGTLAFTQGTAAVKYTPTFAYVTNSGSDSITELDIADGGLSFLTGSPISDTNGPQASVATEAGTFLYTGNSNGSLSEYSIGRTGTLTKLKGSPVTGLSNPVGLAISPFYNVLYAMDPTAGGAFDYDINAKTGVLSLIGGPINTDGHGPDAIAVDPFGAFTLVVDNASNYVGVGIPGSGFVNTVETGSSPVAILIDPSNQFVYVANSGDGTVSGYSLSLSSPYLTPLSGSPWTVGTMPTAVATDPWGQYLYVANGGSDTISAFSIDPLTGALTSISGTFSTSGSPSALAVSNDGKYIYATDKDVNELDQFSINADGSLTAAGGAGVGTAPTSVTTIGTYK